MRRNSSKQRKKKKQRKIISGRNKEVLKETRAKKEEN